ncbi:MAG: HD domain-containing phosphohydrolase [Streptosporangiaceae bacterium]
MHRFRIGLEFALSGFRDLDGMIAQHADIACSLAAELGLPDEVQNAIAASYERWDGRGWPGELRGDSVPLASRLAQLAEYMEVAHRVGGEQAAVAMARERRGTQFDPDLANLICTDTIAIFGGLGTVQTWSAVIGAEPALSMTLSGEQLDAALLGVANFVDLKSPYMLGHASAVAKLASIAGATLGLDDSEVELLRRAALVSGLGRLGISNSIWDKPGPARCWGAGTGAHATASCARHQLATTVVVQARPCDQQGVHHACVLEGAPAKLAIVVNLPAGICWLPIVETHEDIFRSLRYTSSGRRRRCWSGCREASLPG